MIWPARVLIIALLVGGCGGQAFGENPADLVRQGDQLDAQNRNSEAVELYLEAEKLRPDDPGILRRIAMQYSQMMEDAPGRSEKKRLGARALDYALRARNFAPDDAQARVTLAVCYGKVALIESPRQRMQASRRIYEEALAAAEMDPSNSLAWHILGRWQYEVASLNPALRGLVQGLFGRLPEASYSKAVEYLEKAVRLDPSTVLYHAELGRAYLATGEKEKAREEFAIALRLPVKSREDAEAQKRAREVLKSL